MKDFSLNSGERQVGKSLSEIRRDHLARYEKAVGLLKYKKHDVILDCFCGNGYGSHMLAKELPGSHVLGIDASKEAVDFANEYYALNNLYFTNKLFPFELPYETFDAVISFESVEHVNEGNHMLTELAKSVRPGGFLIFSVPNEKVNSLKINKHKFHVKHYTNEEIKEYFKGKLEFSKMYGQDVYVFREGLQSELLPENKMELVESYEGQVIIYVYQKEPVKNGFIRNFFK